MHFLIEELEQELYNSYSSCSEGTGKTTPQISLVLGSVNTQSSGYTTLYRAVNQAEFDELMSTGKFDAGKNGLDVKFFAEKYNDAVTWGNKMNGAGNSRIIEVRIPNKTADNSENFYRWENGQTKHGVLW